MSDDKGAPSPQAGVGAESDNPQAGTPDSGTPEPQMSAEDLREALRKERLANADARVKLKKLDEYEKAAQAKADAEKSDIDKANAERDKERERATAAYQKYAAAATKVIAKELGFKNADIAYKLIRDDLKIDAEGEPENAQELLEALLKSSPELKAEAPKAEPPKPAISAAGGNRAQANTGQPQPDGRMPRLGDIKWNNDPGPR